MAFFEDLRTNSAEKFVDAELVGASDGSGRLDDTQREVYEATCREGLPLVRNCVWAGGGVCSHTYTQAWQQSSCHSIHIMTADQ